ncbi:LamG-like jellyroll fold domain-containing protein [Plantactinospora veratri]
MFRDPRLDFTGSQVTLDAWVRPGEWAGSFPIVTKGRAYALQMRDRGTLEFGVTTAAGWASVAAPVPANWYDDWHRVSGVYDGTALRLYVDGTEVGSAARSGALDPGLYEVNVGRNAATQQDDLRTRLARGLVDDVRVYGAALTAAELAADPVRRAALALDFDRAQPRGEFDSLGISLSGTDGLVGTDRYLQPETVEVAWAHAPVRFATDDAATGRVRVHNEQPAAALDLRLRWSLVEVDRTLRSGTRSLRLGPGETVTLDLGAAPPNPQDRQRRLRLEAVGAGNLRYGWDEFAAGGRVVPGVLPSAPGGDAPG